MQKSPDAFRTISEVADLLDLPQHVLRFWETRFSQIKPMKRGGGRRYYRPEDVDLLKGIRHLLYEEGYTIKGLQRILKEQGNKFVISIGNGEMPDIATVGADQANGRVEPAPVEAVSVSQMQNAGQKPQRQGARGLINKLRPEAKSDGVAQAQGELALDSDDFRNLQATLYELLECKRLLDQVRSD